MPNSLTVRLDLEGKTLEVGTLAYRDRSIFFEYAEEALDSDLELSPFRLPLSPGVKKFDAQPFEGLAGLFSDSLPDGWGRLLLDRALRADGRLPGELTALDRLAYVGDSGMGALTYSPSTQPHELDGEPLENLEDLSNEMQTILSGEASNILPQLIVLNGSSAGARPKAMVNYNPETEHIVFDTQNKTTNQLKGYQSWIVKFPNQQDGKDAGAVEKAYAIMADNAGIEMTATHLFPSDKSSGFFATQRFDRSDIGRHHIHSVAGLLHADFRAPSLDYRDLLDLTEGITRDRREVLKMYRLAVFNVLAHNRDDHAKNFSFIMNKAGEWRLSPAYDLTFSSGPNGEQSMMVMGEGQSPGIAELSTLADYADIPAKTAADIIDQTKAALMDWPTIASDLNVLPRTLQTVQKALNEF